MALTVCLDCGGNVSTRAAACPHCGAPPPQEPVHPFRYAGAKLVGIERNRTGLFEEGSGKVAIWALLDAPPPPRWLDVLRDVSTLNRAAVPRDYQLEGALLGFHTDIGSVQAALDRLREELRIANRHYAGLLELELRNQALIEEQLEEYARDYSLTYA